MRSPNQKIHINKLSTAQGKLSQLESKPKSELTLRSCEINSMNDSTNLKQAVKSSSTTRTSSSTANSKKAKAKSQSIGNRSNSTKTNILSGRSDNLESEFNSF